MTGPQLKALRISRGLTQNELADFLGDCSNAAVSRWEASEAPVAQWVAEKMLRSTSITLPLETLAELMDYASRNNLEFTELLARAIQSYLLARKPPPSA